MPAVKADSTEESKEQDIGEVHATASSVMPVVKADSTEESKEQDVVKLHAAEELIVR